MSVSALAVATLATPTAHAATGAAGPVTLQVAQNSLCSDSAARTYHAIYCTLAGATTAGGTTPPPPARR